MRKLYEPRADSPMKVAVFMSGSGSNAIQILANQTESPYQVTAIFTDNRRDGNNAEEIGRYWGVPVETHDFKEIFRELVEDPKDLSARPRYYEMVLKSLQQYGADCIAMAGYMLLVTEPLLTQYSGRIFNVHPADLSIRDKDGMAKYTGDNAVSAAILDGQREIRATTHVAISATDQGSPLVVSEPVEVIIPEGITAKELRRPENRAFLREIAYQNQNRLKEVGDWKIYPLTIKWISEGRFAVSSEGTMHMNGVPIPDGYRMG